jgi:diguanylate cyclase (GGDEF)-like protein
MKQTDTICADSGSFSMTGLPVRQSLAKAVADAETQGQRVAVLVIKVSDLCQVNHGHDYETGDKVIAELMSRISRRLVDGHLVGRLGGGHFLAITRFDQQTGDSGAIIKQLIDDIARPIDFPSGTAYVSCAIGASILTDDTRMSDELLCNAELALRRTSCGSYTFYRPEFRDDLNNRLAIRSALAGALDRDELYLVYQPQVCWHSGKVFGVEALLRWQSATLGTVTPDRFIPVAEEAGLMPQIGAWVMNRACLQAREWLDAGTPVRIAVNASAAQLETGDFVARVSDTLTLSRLPPSLLEIEVTESMLVRELQNNRETLAAIRDLGVKLGLDDFGTGYSSLAYLRNFTFDTLKIDRLFTSSLTEESHADVLVRAIIAMGEELGHEVIAEGIETHAQKAALIQLGCSRMQGFLFGRPMPASELGKMLRATPTSTSERPGLAVLI